MNKTILIAVAAVAVIGAILFFAFSDSNVAPMNTNTADNNASTTAEVNEFNAQQNAQNQNEQTTVTTPSNRVVLAETVTGNFVTVTQASLTKSGYVVLYRVNSNGDSSVIGHSNLLDAGAHANLNIQLDDPIGKQQAVVAVLHEDDGDEKFEYPDADGYLVSSGNMLANDIDVVDVKAGEAESKVLEAKIATYLENNFQVQ